MPKYRPRRSVLLKNKRHQNQTQVPCYSVSRFLVDTLENSGFAIRRLEQYGHSLKRFSLDVEIPLDDETLLGLLNRRLKNASHDC
jgi:hypothetical protein